MKGMPIRLAAIAVGFLCSLNTLTAEITCDPPLRLKPVRCICGRLTDPTGGRIPDINMVVLKNNVVVARVTSGPDGKFQFRDVTAGDYELSVQSSDWLKFRYSIVVTKPRNKCGRRLEILLEVGGENCGSRVIKQ